MLKPMLWTPVGRAVSWERRRLRELGRDEAFLEERLAEAPGALLGLDPVDMPGPLVVLRQCEFTTAQGRPVLPDLVVLSPSGQVAIVEVKLHDNQELREPRRVVSQIIDYAAALSDCDEATLLEVLGRASQEVSTGSWEALVSKLFHRAAAQQGLPLSVQDWGTLARRFVENVQAGALHLVIACDEMPVGLREMVTALSRQSALDFRMHVAEVATFVRRGADELLFMSAVPVRTEVVARTVVTVTYQPGQVRPGVEVKTTSLEDVESGLQSAKAGTGRRTWTERDFLEQLKTHVPPDQLPAAERLYGDLVKDARAVYWGSGRSPSFSPRVQGFGARSAITLWSNGDLSVNYGYIFSSPEAVNRGIALARAFGPLVGDEVAPEDTSPRYPRYAASVWTPHVEVLLRELQAE